MQDASPFNPIPPVILALVLLMAGVELTLNLAENGLVGGPRGVGWRLAAIEDWGFAPRVLDFVLDQGVWAVDLLKRFVTYPFVHGSFTHAAFAVVITLAMGKYAGEVMDGFALGLVFFACAIMGALVFGAVTAANVPLYGAYPPAYGLIGAFSYILWTRLGRLGENQLLAFRLIAFLFALQLVFALLFGANPTWTADVTGFVTGFALSPLLVPGGWQALRARLRRR